MRPLLNWARGTTHRRPKIEEGMDKLDSGPIPPRVEMNLHIREGCDLIGFDFISRQWGEGIGKSLVGSWVPRRWVFGELSNAPSDPTIGLLITNDGRRSRRTRCSSHFAQRQTGWKVEEWTTFEPSFKTV